MADAYSELEQRFARMHTLEGAVTALEWDASTYMPDGGAEARASQMALLRVMRHALLTAEDVGERMAKGEAEDLDEWQKANLREMRRRWVRATAIPSSLVEAQSQAVSACEMRWRTARKENDFDGLLPSLSEVLRRTREVGEAVGGALGVSAYDALLDEWEPAARAVDIDRVFADVLTFLPALVQQVIDHQAQRPAMACPSGPFPKEKQLALAHKVMGALGFDFRRGRLDTSAHPFCLGIRDDVRITTRWDEADYAGGLFGVIHETGHALYQQGLPARWDGQPVGDARGMSIHESQSLLFEMQVARSAEFVSWLADAVRDAFGGVGPSWEEGPLRDKILRVERSLIRTEADEVTYPLHVILRFRLERAMISGDLALRDLPGAFADGMEKLVGIRPNTVSDGCLQDIHWPAGYWGYFPTYTQGALTAAQLFAAAVEAAPSIPSSLAKGDTSPLLSWLGPHVHQLGSRYSASELVVRATGRALDPNVFRRHVERRYLR